MGVAQVDIGQGRDVQWWTLVVQAGAVSLSLARLPVIGRDLYCPLLSPRHAQQRSLPSFSICIEISR